VSAPTVAQVQFSACDIPAVVESFVDAGCILLRQCFDIEILKEIRSQLHEIHRYKSHPHAYVQDFGGRALPHERLMRDRHRELLRQVFGEFEYWFQENNISRRIDPTPYTGEGFQYSEDESYQGPLPPHLDAFVHTPKFTVNFWVPLQHCGEDTPRLGVVRTPFANVLRFTGYNGPESGWLDAQDPNENYGLFRPEMKALADGEKAAVAEFRARFAQQLWIPTYQLGDAMLLSNWTLHFTHAVPGMRICRENLEIRYMSAASVEQVLASRLTATAPDTATFKP
jgi:hypothetical protein